MKNRRVWKKEIIEFEIYLLRYSSIGHLFTTQNEFNLDPDYQREGTVWDLNKKQFFIDSLLNRFDIPKLYVHDLPSSGIDTNENIKYAVVDGKQRLTAIWQFMAGDFPLPDDFRLLWDSKIKIESLNYQEIVTSYPKLGTFFSGIPLPIEVIVSQEIDLIEELFSRLNEAVPLNAPEKRNAFGGPVPKILKKLCEHHPFFKKRLGFKNSRYRYLDLACKFLLLESAETIVSLKKKNLDDYVIKMRNEASSRKPTEHEKSVVRVLDAMDKIFTNQDSLLKNVGVIVPIYWLFKRLVETKTVSKISRKDFVDFETSRIENRKKAETNQKSDYLLLRFDELNSTVNDAYAIEFKYALLADRAASWLKKIESNIKEILRKEVSD